MGGGDGKFALWIDCDFRNGASHPCKTFDNDCLSSQTDFVCDIVEVRCCSSVKS
jgi:hypothetical protein